MGARVDETILEMQKKLYKEELIKDLRSKHGSQFYPFCIEPMPTERDRLIKPMTDADRALRKQWLEDQKLSPREPVDVPEWTRKNIFRRVYHGFFDGFCNVFKPILVGSLFDVLINFRGRHARRHFAYIFQKSLYLILSYVPCGIKLSTHLG
ncbi:unnamed protein product [Schistocephalus solidus]|uniref:NADH dehydrogenase [ubiquinone] 1 beta subcomplex subunit 6 n=1 Tax=Schistocephalus solidus TaxID=70667 RepID=A0A183TTS4_SCHSO|nr:unnamed protein product [Schistocephalus solidus]